ncbi:MAG TPA: U32 family peptidase [Bacillota bacterium]|nr:U32 family peptidase [Bacillota bacterium]
MKVKAPVRSLDAARLIIKAGAKEVYFSASLDEYDDTTSARPLTSKHDHLPCQLSGEKELKELVRLAHDNGVRANYAINRPSVTNEAYVRVLMDEMTKAVDAGVDALIIGDIAILKKARERNFGVKLYSSTFMDIINTGMIRVVKRAGADRIMIPHGIGIDEVKALTRDPDLEYEAFIHLGCSHFQGTCSLCVSPRTTLPCRYRYHVTGRNGQWRDLPFLSGYEDCSLCSLRELGEANVESLKIVGRDVSPAFIAVVTRLYVMALNAYAEGATSQEAREMVVATFPDWGRFFCEEGSCKYRQTTISKYYI